MNEARFVHLHLHSEYSLRDSTIRLPGLMQHLKEQGATACALTDDSNFFGLIKFYSACEKAGIKPIAGMDIWLEPEGESPERAILLCQDQQGYRNLCQLISRAYQENLHHGRAMIRAQWLQVQSQGLIALLSGRAGPVHEALAEGDMERLEQRLQWWKAAFPDHLYLEVHRVGFAWEEAWIQAAAHLGHALELPLVATNAVRFLEPDDYLAHEVRICINRKEMVHDPKRQKRYTEQQYLCNEEEMLQRFADLPGAVENSVEIARRCNLELELGTYYLPAFELPDGMDEASFMTRQAREGLEKRLQERDGPASGYSEEDYLRRLEWELETIIQMGFPGYFLIVADIIQWAKDHQIPVGPGRGSGAGSLVAWALRITDLDPLEHELLFERFLNPERVSMPDFDIDICMDKRDQVIDYIARRYGRNQVSQIITFGSMAAKAVVRDVGRVMGMPFPVVDRIAKAVPGDLGMTLTKALQESEAFQEIYQQDEEARELIDMALKLEGLVRNPGKHAGGVVIAPSDLTDFTPLYCDESDENSLVSQYDKNDVESAGLVKFDFLGLKTLTIVDWAVDYVRQLGHEVDIRQLPPGDRKTYEMLQQGHTVGVFQLESAGMRGLVMRLKPDNFADLTALLALYRPGPLGSGMVDDYVERKHGRQEIAYPHPELETILKPTYGTILYQEQVMQIAQILANYSLGGADLLRRAMGKKKPEEMAKQGKIFLEGAKQRGIDEQQAQAIFDTMAKFAEYGFNKSHSAAYAVVSYQTAWLKAHYPAAFMAAVMTADMDHTDKLRTYVFECRKLGVRVLPPDINESLRPYRLVDAQTLRVGLGAIKGVGSAPAEAIVTEREAQGPYQSLADFCNRLDTGKINRKMLEALILSGAMDCLGENRPTLLANVDKAMQAADQLARNRESGQNDLFGGSTEETVLTIDMEARPDLPLAEKLREERKVLGYHLSAHPLDAWASEIPQFCITIGELPQRYPAERMQGKNGRPRRHEAVLAGIITSVNRSEHAMLVDIEDGTGQLTLALNHELAEQHESLLQNGQPCVFKGRLTYSQQNHSYMLRDPIPMSMQQAIGWHASALVIQVHWDDPAQVEAYQQAIAHHTPGSLKHFLQLHLPDGQRMMLNLSSQYSLRYDEQLEKALQSVPGFQALRLDFGA